MGNIKKVATQEDLEKVKGEIQEAIARSVTAMGNYNSTIMSGMESRLMEAINRSVTANGTFNTTTMACIDEIHETTVSREG